MTKYRLVKKGNGTHRVTPKPTKVDGKGAGKRKGWA